MYQTTKRGGGGASGPKCPVTGKRIQGYVVSIYLCFGVLGLLLNLKMFY